MREGGSGKSMALQERKIEVENFSSLGLRSGRGKAGMGINGGCKIC